jgi:type IV pilus assembly protein PilY1
MVEAWQYFSGDNKSYYNDVKYTSPIQYYCQRNFIILITDGEPTQDWTFPDWVLPAIAGQYDTTPQAGNSNYPFYLDGVAWYLNTFDADSKLVGVQNVPTYPIGFTIAHPLLQRTAEKGGGLYFTADNAAQLTDALEKALKDIGDKSYAFTSPSVPAVRINDSEDNVVYLTSFEPSEKPLWKGNVVAYSLKADGTLAVDGNGNPDQSYLLWNAHEKFKTISPGSRKIYTYVGGALKPFTSANLTKENLAVSTEDERDKLVSHIRGQDTYDLDPKDGNTTNDKRSKLGDIFHSNPVIVGRPSPFFEDEGFDGSGGFYQNNKDRTKVIITGANDGMLHAFNAATGAEEWAFIPNSLLTNLKTIVTTYTYYVDSSPKVADVWFGDENVNNKKDPDEWRTLLVCGLRKGGKHYFALDITDTRNPKYLWEFPKPGDSTTLAKLGQSWSESAIGRVKIEEGAKVVEKWVAFIGGGFDPSEQKDKDAVIGRALFVIDIKTGEIIKEFSGYSEMKSGFAAPPTALDTNFDGYVDKVYIGDQGGRMWVFTVTSNKTTEWTGAMLFQAPGSTTEKHPIYYQPAVAFDRYRTPWVYFGTGNRENPTDTSNPAERFYAVKDDGLGNYPRKENTDLEDVTSNNTFVSDQTKKGWFIMLAKGEQVLAKSAVFYQLVYFTTYTYIKSNDPCLVDSIATLYIVEYLSGGGAYLVDELSDLGKTPSHRSEVIGVGVPSAPVISVNMKGKASVIIGTTSGQVFSKEAFSPTTNKELLYWREVMP